MAHTPGPWRTDCETEHQTVLGPDDFMVADCAIFGFGEIASARHEAVCRANAALIAAAPDMYEALRHILEAIDTCGDDAVHYALANHQTLGDVVSEARAALAKARAASKEG